MPELLFSVSFRHIQDITPRIARVTNVQVQWLWLYLFLDIMF